MPTTEGFLAFTMMLDMKMGLILPECGQVSGLLPPSVEKMEVIYPSSPCP